MKKYRVAVLGAGLAGSCAALKLARYSGVQVSVYDKQPMPINGASLHNEGKLHLGYVYGADPDAATHKIMVQGSLSFLGLIESLTGVSKETFASSLPFIYGVPQDSQLSLEQQATHFEQVDQCIAEVGSDQSTEYAEYQSAFTETSSLLSTSKLTRCFSSAYLQGALQTPEYSVNTSQVSNVVGASLLSSENIHFFGDTEVLSAEKLTSDEYQVECQQKGEPAQSTKFDAVINCLWEDRLRVDQSVGIAPPRAWLVRYKAAISGFSNILAHSTEAFPSLTLITGAYGDFVNHGNGQFYLSWYPVCKLGESQALAFAEIEKNVAAVNRQKLVHESFLSMSNYFPGLREIGLTAEKVKVGGGYIFAWGKSDITDPASGLHQRHLIGVEAQDRWLSVNTGKYCTAPLFGVQAAVTLMQALQGTG